MTILIVRIVPEGIIFGADRNVTEERTEFSSGKTIHHIFGQNQRQKVLRWPNRQALIGYAGVGTIGGLPTDEWLYDFIGEHISFSCFEDLAHQLKDAVQEQRKKDEGDMDPDVLIIHLAGFEKRNSTWIPVIWYIRNSYSLVNGYYGDRRKEFACDEVLLGEIVALEKSQMEPQLQNKSKKETEEKIKAELLTKPEKIINIIKKCVDYNQPLGFQQGLDLPTFNTFDTFMKRAISFINIIHPEYSVPETLEEWEKVVKFSILTYEAFFQTYNNPGEQYVGGGADIVTLKWPQL
jgi:hypothetical protein